MHFDFHIPTRIRFGRGRLDELGSVVAEFADSALLMTGRHAMKAAGFQERALASLRAAGVRGVVFDQISANPRSDEVDRALELARGLKVGAVVGMGGGSVLDSAKATAAAIHLGPVGPLVGTTLAADTPTLPMIAVPTTAGSGAEVTKGAILTDTARGFKSGIRGDAIFPRAALVDPALTDGLPRHVALESGFDALAHAIEGAVARRSTALNKNLSRQAVDLLSVHLREVADGRADAESRDALSLAALLGGINVATASTCLPHRLQQAMGRGARNEPSHGLGLAILYPAWLRAAYPYAPTAFDDLAAVLGDESIHQGVGRLLKDTGLDITLTAAGYAADDIAGFLANLSGNVDNDPITDIPRELIAEIYRNSL
ncbi:iron-containing alcohol dehydrogenase [Streptomyces sp. WAC 01529]|uniref:iron-containing alcohol dehydrogenase n=1 Tax=Streptomyces sp. WAC 01529 TaxID=2203205 RepID=UPI000F6C414F|nr:iron-containing alcohol dehydrogenase [Streptomyces sp. WAC 01529]AZM57168.1 iron-containing alcohol dehydrogenase [Streptomyces sp. WAC 01529]